MKKEKEVERWHIELEEIMDNETIECLLEMIKEYSWLIACQDYPLKVWEKEAIYIDVLDAYYDISKTIEKLSNDAKFDLNKEQENALEILHKEVAAECDALIQKLAPREKKPTREPEVKLMLIRMKKRVIKR